MFERIVWIVLDSVGIGAMPDWAAFGDPEPSDTLGNIARTRPLHLPNFARLGLGNIKPIPGVPASPAPLAAYGRCALASPGKDTTTGHWEMAGIQLAKPFPLYPHGFPPAIIGAFERATGRRVIGNKAASGTEIIAELGHQHQRTGDLIVYTSADSVFQIAAHVDVVPLAELYRYCAIARGILSGPHEVGRVIARPFTGAPGAYTRTPDRHDYAVPPPRGMLLDQLAAHQVPVHSIGKIADIFLDRGISSREKTKSNADGMARTLAALHTVPRGLIFVNLVDFDSLYGHRNDVEGYARALEATDAWLPACLEALSDRDLLILTADHGCDPTTASTDHSREYTPLLVYGRRFAPVPLGTRASLADIGQTVAANFGTAIASGVAWPLTIAP